MRRATEHRGIAGAADDRQKQGRRLGDRTLEALRVAAAPAPGAAQSNTWIVWPRGRLVLMALGGWAMFGAPCTAAQRAASPRRRQHVAARRLSFIETQHGRASATEPAAARHSRAIPPPARHSASGPGSGAANPAPIETLPPKLHRRRRDLLEHREESGRDVRRNTIKPAPARRAPLRVAGRGVVVGALSI